VEEQQQEPLPGKTNDEGSSTSNSGTSVAPKADDHKALGGTFLSNNVDHRHTRPTTFHIGHRLSNLKLPSPRQSLNGREHAPTAAGGGKKPEDSGTKVHLASAADPHHPSVGQDTTTTTTTRASFVPLASSTRTKEEVVVSPRQVVEDVEHAKPPRAVAPSGGNKKIAPPRTSPIGVTPPGAKVAKLRRSTVTGGGDPVSDYRFVSS
jgi:hypothetical protein